jgi:hypothetical protein
MTSTIETFLFRPEWQMSIAKTAVAALLLVGMASGDDRPAAAVRELRDSTKLHRYRLPKEGHPARTEMPAVTHWITAKAVTSRVIPLFPSIVRESDEIVFEIVGRSQPMADRLGIKERRLRYVFDSFNVPEPFQWPADRVLGQYASIGFDEDGRFVDLMFPVIPVETIDEEAERKAWERKKTSHLILFRKTVEAFERNGARSEAKMTVKNLRGSSCLGIVCTDGQWEVLSKRQREVQIFFVDSKGERTAANWEHVGHKGSWLDSVENCHYLVPVRVVGDFDVVVTMTTDLAEAIAGQETEIVITKSPAQTKIWWERGE